MRSFLTLGLVLALLVAPPCVGGQEPAVKTPAASADEPFAKTLSLDRTAAFLDGAAANWTRRHQCGNCHTSYAYLMARSALPDPKAPGLVRMRQFFEDRVAHWDEKDGLPDDRTEAITEVVATAATLAFDDRTTGSLSASARKMLARMWKIQAEDGSWDWNKHFLPPQEYDDYYGTVFAAIGVGHAPENYAKSDEARDGVKCLRKYFTDHAAPNLHHKTLLLWASTKLDGLMTAEERRRAVDELLALQREDGGWNLPSLGDWKRLDGSDNDRNGPSDGYATGLIVYVSCQVDAAPEKPLRRGVDWLKTHQRESGRWFTRSLNADRAHYTATAGTAYASLALKAYAEKIRP